MRWIVEEFVEFVERDGQRANGQISIGMPGEIAGIVECEVKITPLISGVRTIRGATKLQALVAALQLVGAKVGSFMRDGGRVVDPKTDDDLGIEHILGPLLVS